MEEVPAVRRAAREAVRDIEPDRLRTDILARIEEASAAPGVLTLLSTDGAADADGPHELAAGVQLVYEGLRLTRRLAHEEPWAAGDGRDADVAMLVADVLVSRGFFLLARTRAADPAVDMVRTFGRDQSRRLAGEQPRHPPYALEVDALELAVLTGQAAAGRPLPDARGFARDLVEEHDGRLPPANALASDPSRSRLGTVIGGGEVRAE